MSLSPDIGDDVEEHAVPFASLLLRRSACRVLVTQAIAGRTSVLHAPVADWPLTAEAERLRTLAPTLR